MLIFSQLLPAISEALDIHNEVKVDFSLVCPSLSLSLLIDINLGLSQLCQIFARLALSLQYLITAFS